MIKFRDLKKKWMKDVEFVLEYEVFFEEFVIVKVMIEVCIKVGLI